MLLDERVVTLMLRAELEDRAAQRVVARFGVMLREAAASIEARLGPDVAVTVEGS